MGKREWVALLNLSSWCLAVPGGCLQFVIVVFPDHTHLLFLHAKQLFSPAKLHVFTLYLHVLVSSADNFCKQFGPRSGPTKCRA